MKQEYNAKKAFITNQYIYSIQYVDTIIHIIYFITF